MTDGTTPASDLDEIKAGLYSGRLEDFIRQRDALAKEYRSSGNRAVADRIKALRKPSRLAWALNAGISNSPEAFKEFDHAVAGAVHAHSTGADIRAAMAVLHGAVRELADAAADAASRAGHKVEASALSTAILAVLGSSQSYAELRSRHLVEIPEGGGLDGLASLPTSSATGLRTPALRVDSDREQQSDSASIRAEAARAAEHLANVRARADSATQGVHIARAEVAAAEQRVREAEQELDAAGRRYENARREAAAATAELQDAEAAHQAARRKLNHTSTSRQQPTGA